MPNSEGEQYEKTNLNQENTNVKIQNKRKRNRNRKKNAVKIENLVSKTFQEKLEANGTPNKNHIGKKAISEADEAKKSVTDQHYLDKITLKNSANQIDSKQYTVEEGTQLASKPIKELKIVEQITNPSKMVKPQSAKAPEKTREEILAEREAKKLAKQQAKKKSKEISSKPIIDSQSKPSPQKDATVWIKKEYSTATISERHKKSEGQNAELDNKMDRKDENNEKISPTGDGIATLLGDSELEKKDKKIALTKAERRAIQETQRAAKAEAALQKPVKEKKAVSVAKEVYVGRTEKLPVIKPIKDCKVKLFNHLENCRSDSNLFVNNLHIHPIIVRLGEQYSKRTIVGSNARCISFLNALKTVIQDYETPAKKEFARSLETIIKNSVDHLHKCRPLAVSVCNAYKHIKHVLTQLPVDQPESELKERLCHFIDTYIENQIEKAAQAISSSVQDKISNGDVILTFGCSSLINYIFEEAHRRHVDFRVIVVDSRPFSEGQELLRRLALKEIPCTYVLINAVGFVMPEVTKILLGAHALLSNGYVMARTGTAQVALVARSFNVPVLVCCETHKFSERFQTDAIVYNELGNPNDLIISDKCRLTNWKSLNKLSLLNLNYDITPPELVTAVVTEVAILPCTSVPVILRIKPTEIGY